MATQSLYRRYRPRRFSEVKGQDHVVRALRSSVAEGREGQAYLFSGPRGTGKTTSARILAKVLNCTAAVDGEPCCECESCLAVERGTSYDVHELDAASNNGVDSMRDLIEKASLGTPGRHKVYILDEVHMLTKGAEAALLKTLEEPPPHVVFVLATTDPQKMSDTIRSRTQHLQFHLFSADELHEHVRWVAADAGLTLSDAAIDQVVRQGAGSARDALSALELVSNAGGEGDDAIELGDFVEAMIDRDAGRALSMVAGAINIGRDPRALTEELIGFLRDGFLSIMAPDVVQLPSQQVELIATQARRLGAAGLVRGIEHLGEALTEMRHAPDPRVLLDVAAVRLASDAAGDDVGALIARVAKLEQQVAAGTPQTAPATAPASGASAAAPAAEPPPVSPTTGRAQLGGRARRAASRDDAAGSDDPGGPGAPGEVRRSSAAPSSPAAPRRPAAAAPADDAPAAEPAPSPAAVGAGLSRETWEDSVRPALRGMARAVYAPATFVTSTSTSLTLSLPNPVHRDKCEQHRSTVEQALSAATGSAVTLDLVLGDGDGDRATGPSGGSDTQRAATAAPHDEAATVAPSRRAATADSAAADPGSPGAGVDEVVDAGSPDDESDAEVYVLPEEHEVDLDGLVDAPPESVKTPIDRLAEAFPGSELVDEPY